jgi:hypothetical protein
MANNPKLKFETLVKSLQKAPEYKNYLEARAAVLAMMANDPGAGSSPSRYWQEELSGFDYMLDASPLIVRNLRHHCYHIAGIHEYDYRDHHQHKRGKVEKRLKHLRSLDGENLLVAENPALGGYGYKIDGAKYNADTVNFYECLLAMKKGGVLDNLKTAKERQAVLEIGSGWGGLAYQLKSLFPNVAYIMVDLPPTFVFSITYLKTLFPKAKFLIANGSAKSADILNKKDLREYDFIFIPHYLWPKLNFRRPEMILNRASFQEMTSEQVDDYAKKAKEWDVPVVYSMNRDRSPHNTEMTSVREILGRYYKLQEIAIKEKADSGVLAEAKKALLSAVTGKKGLPDELVHRHVVARLP